MSGIAIQADKLSKRYRVGHLVRYRTLRDTMTGALRAPVRLFKRKPHSDDDFLWALRDVSFEVHPGEVVGVLGRNGAGKTTLLKVLSRITRPTGGRAVIHGMVGSLLEVGTGFHPELTGRENISLSAAILGMKKQDLASRFGEIVEFSGVERFLDTPLKHYSTGMQTRLAFSVAAHLDPEILLVDEVLAVGDAEFQKQCLGKMQEVSRGGRTVLLVSHHLNQIRRLCDWTLWLESGRIREMGPTPAVVSAYEAAVNSGQGTGRDRPHAKAQFVHWELANNGDEPYVIPSPGPVTVRFTLRIHQPVSHAHHGITLFSGDGQVMWGAARDNLKLETGDYILTYQLPYLPLRPGPYYWRVTLYDENGLVDTWDSSPELVIATVPLSHPRDEWAGILNMPHEFDLRRETASLTESVDTEKPV